ncbi:MAG: hypothetical protein ABIJ97_17555 [Bacteroidota bacterium]
MELTDIQKAALKNFHNNEPVDVDYFNKLMEGTGIKIVRGQEGFKQMDGEIKKYVESLQKRGKSNRYIKRKVKQKFNHNII